MASTPKLFCLLCIQKMVSGWLGKGRRKISPLRLGLGQGLQIRRQQVAWAGLEFEGGLDWRHLIVPTTKKSASDCGWKMQTPFGCCPVWPPL